MRSIVMCALLGLGACTSSQIGSVVAAGQLVCAVGPTVVAMASIGGAAILAEGASKPFVDAACAAIGGIAVSPPAMPIPTVTIVKPAGSAG